MEREVVMKYINPYMNQVMTPPMRDTPEYDAYTPSMSTMRIVPEVSKGLGQVQAEEGGFLNMSISTIAISALVISALAFMALCVVSMSGRR